MFYVITHIMLALIPKAKVLLGENIYYGQTNRADLK